MDVSSRIKIDEAVGSAKLRKLQKIGDTIWWPKQAALETIFGPLTIKKRNIFCHAKVLSGVSENSLTKVAKITGVDPLSLKEELCCLAKNFTVLSRSLPDESEGASDDVATMTSTNEEESSEEESSDNEDGGVSNPILRNRNAARKGNCKKCLACCHKILFKYSLITLALTNLFVVYEHLLTLSFTQVNCERAFSRLKQIKTRLKSS
ncbi:Hypothetical predicted protein [Paramuricea clavata]|uniref:Uncharacterized protein n=1 Tax=Paramuricea clavata TaxID=317549 RepID=A0A6S7H036_PARCT|nr:Hypothetical predicted protein [Paramuricea clavata]